MVRDVQRVEGIMIERVAQAIYEAHLTGGLAKSLGWDELSPAMKQHWLLVARAAVSAMREPTRIMEIAGNQGLDVLGCKGIFRDMIDAELMMETDCVREV